MIPLATLEPGVPAFRVISIAGGALQSRAGRDGKLQWQTRVGSAGSVFLTAGAGVIYVSSATTPMVTAVDAGDGRVLWQFTTCVGPDESVLLGQGHLYLTCGPVSGTPSALDDVSLATIYALDARTAKILWTAPREHARAMAGANVITQTSTGLAALNGNTGATLWRHSVAIGPMPPVDGYTDVFQFGVRVGPRSLYYSPDGTHAEALRPSDGTLLWRSGPLRDPASMPNGTFVQHATVALATADIVVTQGIYGVTALRASDGALLWRHYQYPDGSGITSLVGDDGTVYVAKFFDDTLASPAPKVQNPLAALNPRDGSLRWDVDGPFEDHPLLLLDGEMLIVAGPGYVSAFATSDGRRAWLQYGPYPEYLTADAHVVCVQTTSLLYVLKLADGLKVWKQALPGYSPAAPLLLPA
jgi:outer membrane protein assembly factor BamB